MSEIIIALDGLNLTLVNKMLNDLNPKLCKVKFGKELFTRFGPDLIYKAKRLNFDIFLDLKFLDIPNTVEKAIQSSIDLEVFMVDVHLLGGSEMLKAAKKVIEKSPSNYKTLLIGVSILTSMNNDDLKEIGIQNSLEEQIDILANLASQNNLDGVVCSAFEVAQIKQKHPNLKCVTPGIRCEKNSKDDQKRVMTPLEAQKAGSDFLVIGRPITQNLKPLETLENIFNQLKSNKKG